MVMLVCFLYSALCLTKAAELHDEKVDSQLHKWLGVLCTLMAQCKIWGLDQYLDGPP